MAPNTRMSRRSLQVRSVEEGGGNRQPGVVQLLSDAPPGGTRAPLPRGDPASSQVSRSRPRAERVRGGRWRDGEDAGGAMWGRARGPGWCGAGSGMEGLRTQLRAGGASSAVRRGAVRPPGAGCGGIGSARARRSPGSRSRGFVRGSGVGGSAPRRQRRAGAARGRDRNGQRRGSSPARFSQRSSIFRMKEPPSPVPGAVGPWPPPGPPPEDPVPEEVPLGPVMA